MPPNPHTFAFIRLRSLLLLDFLVISVYHIVAVACLACVLGSCLGTCSLGSASRLGLLINLCEELLCALHQFFSCGLDVFNLGVGHLIDGRTVYQPLSVHLRSASTAALSLASILSPTSSRAFSVWNTMESASFLVSMASLRLLILSLELGCLLHGLLDICVRHVGAGGNGDVLLFACSQILSGYVYDTVGIDIKGNLDLRNASSCRRDAVQTELAQGLVVSCKLSLTLYHMDINGGLVIGCCGEDLALLGRDRGVSLNQSVWQRRPWSRWTGTAGLHPEAGYRLRLHRRPACRPGSAAPMATHSSGFKDLAGLIARSAVLPSPVRLTYGWNRLPAVPCQARMQQSGIL